MTDPTTAVVIALGFGAGILNSRFWFRQGRAVGERDEARRHLRQLRDARREEIPRSGEDDDSPPRVR
jgi:hypothetical protein